MKTDELRITAERILAPIEQWSCRCHAASLKVVREINRPARVARGACEGVVGQHSWVVLGMDCYDNEATIIDPTLWSYDDAVTGVWTGTYLDGLHTPHGKGSIWDWGRPEEAQDEPMTLTPRKPWSDAAERFLNILGPLDRNGWIVLAHAPVEEWPAGEIIDALCESGLESYVPMDIVGMLTDRNPSELYLPKED